MTATQTATKVTKGMRFRSVYADSNPLWEVKTPLGAKTWLCVIVDEPREIRGRVMNSEWAGTEKPFLAQDILASVNSSQLFEKCFDDSDRWYNSLRVGDTVHYEDGFYAFVRCEVVMGRDVHCPANGPERKVLKPVALVGDWRPSDLPRRLNDGSVQLGHHAESVQKGECFRPNYGFIYESPAYSKRGRDDKADPRKLPALDLTPPALSEQQAQAARLWRLVKEVKDALELTPDQYTLHKKDLQTPPVPTALLRRAYALLQAEFNK